MAAAIKLWQGAFGVWEFLPVFFLTPLWAELDDPTLKTAEAGVALGHCSWCYWLNCTFFFLIKGPVFAVQTRPWLFPEGGVGDVMLLQKVGSAYAKTAMCFRIQRESPRGCGVTSHVSLIQCYPSSAFMNYVAIHTHGFFVCGVVSCPDLQRGVIKCSIFTGRSCMLFMCAFI